MTASDGRPLPRLLQPFHRKSVVVFRALQLGDMLCAVPALRALRCAEPDASITLVGLPWATQFARRFHHYIDDFVAFPGHPEFPEQTVRSADLSAFYTEMRARGFDLAIQLHGSGEISNGIVRDFGATTMAGFVPTDAHIPTEGYFIPYPKSGPEPLRLLALTRFLGMPATGTHLEFPLTEEDVRELEQSGYNQGLESGSYICIHPGARHRDKCWPPALFASIADRLIDEYGVQVVLTGSANEKDLTMAVARHMRHDAIDAAGPISIGAMAALMHGARLLICNDTGVSHIAAGLRLPSVVIFSKADIRRWAPLDTQLHRCLWDPEGLQMASVLENARELLAMHAVSNKIAQTVQWLLRPPPPPARHPGS